MRFPFAAPIMAIGALLVLLGIGQLTWWAPPSTVTVGVPADASSGPVTVIEAGAKQADAEEVEITVQSDGPFTLAVGRAADVEAWVGEAAHLSVTGVGEDELLTEFTEGEETVPNPSGSDLWTSEETAEGTLTHRWLDPGEGDWSILVAADGETPAPTDISITSPNDTSTPWAIPLIILGALLLILGVALAFMKPRRKRREPVQPGSRAHVREQNRRPDTARSFTARPVRATALLGMAAVLGFSGSAAAYATATESAPAEDSASPTESPAAPEGEAGAYPVVLESQLDRILESVATTVGEADAAADATLLEPRVAGAAATLRSANYSVRAQADEVPAPTQVAPGPVLTSMIPTGSGWPRTVVALTQGDANPVPQALVLVQDNPRSNYRLTSSIQMLPGTTFPTAGSPEGLEELPLDQAEGLVAPPEDAVAAIADYLTDPEGGNSATFEANSFADAITSFQSDVVADAGNDSAEITFTHVAVPEHTRAISTGDGGAMVFGYLDHTYSSVPEGPGDSIELEGTVYEALTGEESTEDGIDVRYGEAVMMYVPPADSGQKITVIGAAQQLLSAELR
ncbi:hypothetical protein GC088_09315 [Arthrobacter sp. JZ12]|uniref:hypothetical protein n=1 Tax=Arthrobacter sp. JZ12 TaxID=2654190 RepID=UPI002B47CC67|nr:hypothetical protein [Arthrobacter sp. JZ12]WRH25238.1 hypothetical protein GC088_09315 [Arthrobacter sp. JZ12]